MREALFVLFVIGMLLAFTAYKYRRQLRMMREVWRVARGMRQMSVRQQKEVEEPKAAPAGKLVHCSKCGTWIPEERAVRLGRTSVFCSAACLEKAATSV